MSAPTDTQIPTGTRPEIHPFRVEVAQEDLDDLRRRVLATRLPTRELVSDRSQGVQRRRSGNSRDTGRTSTTGGAARRG